MKIVLSAVLVMFLIACSSENKKADEAPVEAVKTEATKAEIKTPEVVQEVKQEVQEGKKEAEVKIAEVVEEVKEEKVVEAVLTKTEETVVAQEQKVAKSVASVDGAKLFTKCVACHGANGKKSALNKSKVIQGWSVDQVLSALHGYRAGTYGGSMKGVMKSQISSFSEEELQALAEYISKL